MASALSISFLRRYLLTPSPPASGDAAPCSPPPPDPVGSWLRAGLTTYLSLRHGAPPAILLIRSGPIFDQLRHWSTRSDGFFGRLVHALAHADVGIHTSWTSLTAPALLTLPWLWLLPQPSSPQQPLIPKMKVQKLITDHWFTWGDILWRAAVPMGWRAQFNSHPLGPPAGRSVTLNGLLSPFSRQRHSAGPAISELWNAVWAATPEPVRRSLSAWGSSTSTSFAALRDPSAPPSHGWVPARPDPLALDFPWHLLTISGQRLALVSTASVRRSLQGAPGPSCPQWPTISFSSPLQASSFWRQIWTELSRLPLSATVRATSTLVINRVAWTFHQKLDDDTVSRQCPRGCASDDGMTHGYFDCSSAQEVWRACLPVLSQLGCPPPPEYSPASLFMAPQVPASLRARFALWRSCVLRTVYVCRHTAGVSGREAGIPPDFSFLAASDVLSSTATLLADLLAAAWLRVLRLPDSTRPAAVTAFGKKWVSGGSFALLIDNRLTFAAVSVEPASLSNP